MNNTVEIERKVQYFSLRDDNNEVTTIKAG